MCLQCYFERKLETMEPGETVTLGREALVSLVERREACDPKSPAKRPLAAESLAATDERCSVLELAERCGVGLSTARGWCTAGLFGDAAESKIGRRWSIPEARVKKALARLAAGWRIIDNQWVQPGADGPRAKGVKSRDGTAGRHVKATRNRSQNGKGGATAEPVDGEGPERAGWTDSVSVRTDVRVVVTESAAGLGGE